MNSGANGSDRCVGGIGDLFIRESDDIAQDYSFSELIREFQQSALDVIAQPAGSKNLVGRWARSVRE